MTGPAPTNNGGGRISNFFRYGWNATKATVKGAGRSIHSHIGDTFVLRSPSTGKKVAGYVAAGVSGTAAAAVATKATSKMENKVARGAIITTSGVAGAAAPGAISKLVKALIRRGL
jgi:hypothetical protein